MLPFQQWIRKCRVSVLALLSPRFFGTGLSVNLAYLDFRCCVDCLDFRRCSKDCQYLKCLSVDYLDFRCCVDCLDFRCCVDCLDFRCCVECLGFKCCSTDCLDFRFCVECLGFKCYSMDCFGFGFFHVL